jgi:hypothetical protein
VLVVESRRVRASLYFSSRPKQQQHPDHVLRSRRPLTMCLWCYWGSNNKGASLFH